ncbi:hydrolase [Alphaproteobacteria bacterium]|nr:hydrolase [Alphaproteobacteria bacterium]
MRAIMGLVLSLCLAACASASMAPSDAPRLLVYGDSLAWGYVPMSAPEAPERYPRSVRWTGVLQDELGGAFTVVEEGFPGRTAGVDNQIAPDYNLNGRPTLIPLMKSHEPLAAVIIMLGSNDARADYKQTPAQIAASVRHLVRAAKAERPAPQVLLISPPQAAAGDSEVFNSLFSGRYDVIAQAGRGLRAVAIEEGAEFLDAGTLIGTAKGGDGLHLTPEQNQALASAVVAKLRQMFPDAAIPDASGYFTNLRQMFFMY